MIPIASPLALLFGVRYSQTVFSFILFSFVMRLPACYNGFQKLTASRARRGLNKRRNVPQGSGIWGRRRRRRGQKRFGMEVEKEMDNYNNGPIPPWQNGNSGVPPYYAPPTRHPGSAFATASLVLGIITILSAFTGTVFPPLVCGGLSIILALLSKGNDRVMLPNAKVGVLTGILGLILNVLVVAGAFLLLFTEPELKEDFHRQLNQYYEYFYGESFDDAWDEIEDIYGG